MVVFGIILVAVVFFVVFKVLISEAKPYKKPLNTENAVEEKKVLDNKKKAEPQKAKPATKKTKKSKFEYKTYRVPGGYGYLLGGVGGGGAGNYSKQDDDFDEAEYRAYREELAAYDDFVASLDMDD
jgi:mannitol-specific phosphotransferase system IIBC component